MLPFLSLPPHPFAQLLPDLRSLLERKIGRHPTRRRRDEDPGALPVGPFPSPHSKRVLPPIMKLLLANRPLIPYTPHSLPDTLANQTHSLGTLSGDLVLKLRYAVIHLSPAQHARVASGSSHDVRVAHVV